MIVAAICTTERLLFTFLIKKIKILADLFLFKTKT